MISGYIFNAGFHSSRTCLWILQGSFIFELSFLDRIVLMRSAWETANRHYLFLFLAFAFSRRRRWNRILAKASSKVRVVAQMARTLGEYRQHKSANHANKQSSHACHVAGLSTPH